MFEVHIERRAVKECERIDKHLQKTLLNKMLGLLAENPWPNGFNPKKLKGNHGFRLRIGDYRVLYTVNDKHVLIFAIRHRKDAYDDI
ncbi:MAG: type II toxin-antitoxin system RelE/ParE family toxin [Patescibacteria group bacterium]